MRDNPRPPSNKSNPKKKSGGERQTLTLEQKAPGTRPRA